MRLLFLLLFTASLSAQNTQKISLANRAPCEFTMSKEDLMSKNLVFQCEALFNNGAFKVENFKLKFKGQPTIIVKGNKLSKNIKGIVKRLNPGDSVVFFDIIKVIPEDSNQVLDRKLETLVVKIK